MNPETSTGPSTLVLNYCNCEQERLPYDHVKIFEELLELTSELFPTVYEEILRTSNLRRLNQGRNIQALDLASVPNDKTYIKLFENAERQLNHILVRYSLLIKRVCPELLPHIKLPEHD